MSNDERPCYRVEDYDGEWHCRNDHTGCLYNNGHNLCGHEGSSDQPLEDEESIVKVAIHLEDGDNG